MILAMVSTTAIEIINQAKKQKEKEIGLRRLKAAAIAASQTKKMV